jgi:3-oxoadipate enol-lactonase
MIALCESLEIGYDDVGSGGVPLLFVHAFPLSRRMWAPQLGALLDRSRCIAADLRGFGDTTVEPPYTMDQYADDLACLLDSLGIEKAVVAGLSMGGYVAFAFWRRHRERVRGLILADTRATADNEVTLRKRADLIDLAVNHGADAVADAQIASLLGKSTRQKHPAVVDTVHAMLASAPLEGTVGALEAMMNRPDSTSTLATIDVPTLIVVGDEDAITPAKEARLMYDAIPASRLEVISGAGHLSNFERPAAFNHVVTEFLGVLTYA